jgi:UDP-N-acetylglucosamine 2-epimerase (non-hydrolysing)
MSKKILVVFGTRPEAIKMAPLVLELKKHNKEFQTCICVTAQHRELLDDVLNLFNITPDFDLNLMKNGQDLYDVASGVLLGIRDVLAEFKPDIVLVHGDTATTAITSLACYFNQTMVGHIEAGLRTGDLYSPWPEEGNRLMTAIFTKFHFAPTELSQNNLLSEGVDQKNIVITGNTVIDSLLWVVENVKNNDCSDYVPTNDKFILVTAHRRENFGTGIVNICNALEQLAKQYPDIDIVYPVHPNPNIKGPVTSLLSDTKNIHLISPQGYATFSALMSKAYLILTDSGGIQEEAPSLGKPVLVMRDTTERPEAVDAGVVKLIGTDTNDIFNGTVEILENKSIYKTMSSASNPYGDGTASLNIVNFLKKNL